MSIIEKKLAEAEKLTDKTANRQNVNDAVIIYKNMCMDLSLTADQKLQVLKSFISHVPDEGLDMLARWRDSLKFLKGKQLEYMINFMVKATRCPDIHSKQRLLTAVTLYNNAYIELCYPCFYDMACDDTMLLDDRIGACRYLFATEDETYKGIVQECLIEIIGSNAYPSTYRYQIIASYITKTGFSLSLNASKVKIPYDENFVYGLQNVFFYNEENGVRERILSGQHMLAMSCVDEEEKIRICDIFLKIASDPRYEENVRADAADVVLRLGIGEQVKTARTCIVEMGTAAVDTTAKSLLSRAKTIYSYSQNIHDETISECIEKFIEKFSRETNIHLRPFADVHQEVTDLVRSYSLPPKSRFSALKALNRISVDTATFTKNKTTIAEIFIHVWVRICLFDDKKRASLEKLLVDELCDMGDTCSSGHAGRLVNVLASEDSSLRISFESQIIANIAGRLNARINALKDETLKGSLVMGMMEDADPDDADALKKFLADTRQGLYDELKKEFVGGGYVSQTDFDKFFEKGYTSFP